MSECCIRGIQWDAAPIGSETELAGKSCYVSGSNSSVAVMIIHDLWGWTFKNTRLLADHYAKEIGATVYVPDFFSGEILPRDILSDESRWSELDLPAFDARNSKSVRFPEITECAKALRSKYARTGAVGFCFGGWAVFRLGSKENTLVDCISTAHPTFLEKDEIGEVAVPVQIIAPEFDPRFTVELREFCNHKIPTLGVPYTLQYFPGVGHGFAIRGDPDRSLEREGMAKAKAAVVYWMRQWLHEG
ncbi:putative endo-1,3-1,4-beta-D-glucanase [Poronia punctata]|nr:putative endo-1,3-1,4-beta-D-glucanase [Poronia punctata]